MCMFVFRMKTILSVYLVSWSIDMNDSDGFKRIHVNDTLGQIPDLILDLKSMYEYIL